jgi:hypothetical protein
LPHGLSEYARRVPDRPWSAGLVSCTRLICHENKAANFAVMMTSPRRAGRMPAPAHSCTMTIRNYPQSRYSGCLRQRGVPVKSPVIPNDARPILDPTVLKSPPRRPRQHFYAGRSRPLIRAPPPHNRGIHLDRRRRGQTLGAKLALCCNVGDALGDQSRRKG